MRKPPWPLAALALISVVVAGCGSGAAGTGTSTVTSGGNGTSSLHEEGVKFAECMRANGVGGFPDPSPSGALTLDGVANGSSVDTNSPAWKTALSTCRDLEPPGFTGTKPTPQQTTARLQFAQCVRENGVPDFPDPTPNGPLVDTNRIPSTATNGGMSMLKAAMRKCGQYASAAGVQGRR